MNETLRLDLEKNIVKQAEQYAQKNSISLPKLIENYLISIISVNKTEQKKAIHPMVESLTGVIPKADINYKKEYQDYLLEKYL